jgi:hypothetical protein
MTLPWSEVNAVESQDLAGRIGLPRAARSEARKWGCPFCGSSDALHAYPGSGAGFGCWAACGADQPRGCRGYSNVDVAMQHWGIGAADACRRLAALPHIISRIGSFEHRWPEPGPGTSPAALRLSAQELNLAALRLVPGGRLPPSVYAFLVARLRLTERGAAYLAVRRRLDPDAARAYGYRSLDGPRQWARLAEHLAASFCREELTAAGFPPGRRGAPLTLPFGGCFPALLIPFRRAGELVGIRFRSLLPDRPEHKHNRYRTLKAARPPWPYHADALAARTVHIVEGELNAETLRQLGCDAAGPYGAGAWLDEWTPLLSGADRIVAWYDCSDPKRAGDMGAAALRKRLELSFGSAWTRERWRRMITDRDPNALHQAGRLAPILRERPWEGSGALVELVA